MRHNYKSWSYKKKSAPFFLLFHLHSRYVRRIIVFILTGCCVRFVCILQIFLDGLNIFRVRSDTIADNTVCAKTKRWPVMLLDVFSKFLVRCDHWWIYFVWVLHRVWFDPSVIHDKLLGPAGKITRKKLN